MNNNQFSNALQIACASLVDDRTLRFVWKNMPKGQPASYRFPPLNMILLPRVDATMLTRKQQVKMTANIYHELRHHALSSKEAWEDAIRKGRLVKDLTNALEDARIELCEFYELKGGKDDLTEDNIDICKELTNKDADKQLNNRWGWLSLSLFCYLTPYGKLPVCDELQKYYLAAIKILDDGRFKKSVRMEREGNYIIVKLAEEIVAKWQSIQDEERKEQEKQEKQEQEEEEEWEDEEDEDEEGEDEEEDGDGDEGQNEEGSNQKENEDVNGRDDNEGSDYDGQQGDCPVGDGEPTDGSHGKDQDDDASLPDKGESTLSNTDGSGEDATVTESPDDPDSDLESPAPSERTDEERSKTEHVNDRSDCGEPKDESGGESDGRDDSGSDDGAEGASGEGPEDADSDGTPRPDIKDRPKNIQDQYEEDLQGDPENTPQTVDIRANEVAKMGTEETDVESFNTWLADQVLPFHLRNHGCVKDGEYIPYLVQDREIVPTEYKPQFEKMTEQIKSKMVDMQNELSRIIRVMTQTHTNRFQRVGNLDPIAYYKVPNKSKYIKTTVNPSLKMDSAVTLLIDLSGSMHGPKSVLASQIATLFGEVLCNIPKVSYEIRGYNTSPLTNTSFVNSRTEMEKMLLNDGYTRTEVINHWVFKRFSENWRTVRYRLGACDPSLNLIDSDPKKGGAVGGCNIDHENILLAAHHLQNRHEKNKVMIILCDGQPSGFNYTYNGKLCTELHKAVKKVRNSGINLFCFGIMADEVKTYYEPNVEIVHDLKNLDSKSLRKLAELIIKRG